MSPISTILNRKSNESSGSTSIFFSSSYSNKLATIPLTYRIRTANTKYLWENSEMRRLRRQFYAILILGFFSISIYLYFYTEKAAKQRCNFPAAYHEELLKMAHETRLILKGQKISHFLCYESLWAALRRQKLFPWSSKIIFCILNEDLNKIDENYLIRSFRLKGYALNYDNSEGMYTLQSEKYKGHVEIVVFEVAKPMPGHNLDPLKGNQLRRIGWKRRLLPPESDGLDSFPEALIQQPLPLGTLDKFQFPVPREQIEIQKYHYRDNWWKEVRPEGC